LQRPATNYTGAHRAVVWVPPLLSDTQRFGENKIELKLADVVLLNTVCKGAAVADLWSQVRFANANEVVRGAFARRHSL